ncbi:MAG: dTDP-glucose 4,6-dehydratase [Gammaproteobacteria bacterium]|nr:dTDP-glucose 4,6-dehydratase [Gammaproteobacteria bacterium]
MALDRLLVTGGAGFIGANFVHYWLARHPGHRVVVLDALTYAGNLASLEPVRGCENYRFVHANIGDETLVEDILRREEINAIVHFAAESHVDRSILGPDPFLHTNIMGTHALLKAAKKVWLEEGESASDRRFHHVSTDEVYGSLDFNDERFSESSPYRPNSPYAASKACADHLVRAWHHTYGLDATISNCSNNLGPFQFPEKLIPLMLINILLGRELPVYGDGRHVRDWLYVEDHCRGIELVLERGRGGETYNIGANAERSNLDLVHAVCRAMDALFSADPGLRRRFPDSPAAAGRECSDLIRFVADRPGHDRRYALDAGKIRSELGFAPAHALDTALARTLHWYLDHEDWWRAVMDHSYADWVKRLYGPLDRTAG